METGPCGRRAGRAGWYNGAQERTPFTVIVDRSEALLVRADALTSALTDEACGASRRRLAWMLGAVPFGLILATLALAQVRRIGERTERVARMARRMVEGDVEAYPVDPADRDELVEVERTERDGDAHRHPGPASGDTACGHPRAGRVRDARPGDACHLEGHL